jgi:hypothetical protein
MRSVVGGILLFFSILGTCFGADDSTRNVKVLAFPAVTRAPETSWVFGVATVTVFKTKKSDSLLRTSTIPLAILYSLKQQITITSGVNIYFPGERYIFRLENTYTKFPDKFWGLGYNTPSSNLENYDFNQLFINPQFLKKVYKDYFVGISVEYQQAFYIHYNQKADGTESNFTEQNVTGRDGSHTLGIGIELSRDSRNNTFSPSKGYLIKFANVVYNNAFTSQYNFNSTEIDIRRYIPMFKNQVFGFQLASTLSVGDVPFRSMGQLGSPNIMRGYYGGRYRDKDVVAMQVEQRIPIWWRFGVVAFAALGQVSNDMIHWHLQDVRYSLGGGIRVAILPKERLNLRIDYGFGHLTHNFYLTVAESF